MNTTEKKDVLIYHMCQKYLYDQALQSRTAYYPPTFELDGYFTHATAVPSRLIDTANHFYTSTVGDWICIEINQSLLHELGIVTKYEQPMAVGTTDSDDQFQNWQCPHIYGGIPLQIPGVVTSIYAMKRDPGSGRFLSIDGLTDESLNGTRKPHCA
jgi:uncharacterized protein (DUF952 family)